MNNVYQQAEMDYRRERISREFASAQRFGFGRRGGRRVRRDRLTVVPPYGDARA